MSQISTLGSGAGVQTIVNLQYTPAYVYLGTVQTVPPLQNFSVSIAGRQTININNSGLITAFSQWLMQSRGTGVGYMLKVANGNLPNQETQLRFTNDGVTTPDIFAYSDAKGTNAIFASTSSINASANNLITDFDGLFIDPTNFQDAEFTFSNGFTDRFTATDIASYFLQTNQSDANGLLSTILAVNNVGRQIESVRIYANSSGNVEYLLANI